MLGDQKKKCAYIVIKLTENYIVLHTGYVSGASGLPMQYG